MLRVLDHSDLKVDLSAVHRATDLPCNFTPISPVRRDSRASSPPPRTSRSVESCERLMVSWIAPCWGPPLRDAASVCVCVCVQEWRDGRGDLTEIDSEQDHVCQLLGCLPVFFIELFGSGCIVSLRRNMEC